MLKLLIKYGATLTRGVHEKNFSALTLAVKYDCLEAAKILLENGCKPDSFDFCGMSSFHWAVHQGRTSLVDFFISQDPSLVNLPTSEESHACGGLPMCLAIDGGHLEIVKLLLKNGAGINDKIIENVTPLINAVQQKNFKMVEFLLQSGANIEVCHAATHAPSSLDNPTFESEIQETALIPAILIRNKKIVNLLLKHGAKITIRRSSTGMTPLHAACKVGDKNLVRDFLRRGAYVNSGKYWQGESPLALVCKSGSLDLVKLLVEKYNADVNLDCGVQTVPALSVACQLNHLPIVQYLLGCGANVNRCCSPQNAPLFAACLSDRKEVLKLILHAGAEITVVPKYEYQTTPIFHGIYADLPKKVDYGALTRRLILLGTDLKGDLGLMANIGEFYDRPAHLLQMCKVLLEFGVNIDPLANKMPSLHSLSRLPKQPVSLKNICLLAVSASLKTYSQKDIDFVVDNFMY